MIVKEIKEERRKKRKGAKDTDGGFICIAISYY